MAQNNDLKQYYEARHNEWRPKKSLNFIIGTASYKIFSVASKGPTKDNREYEKILNCNP